MKGKKVLKAVAYFLFTAVAVYLLVRGCVVFKEEEEETIVSSEENDAVGEMESIQKQNTDSEFAGSKILIDAGHGGADPGKVGKSGIDEKTINLQIALLLCEFLRNDGLEVTMTRENENGLYSQGSNNKKVEDLKKRLSIIEQASPQLAVSIHQNSYRDTSVCGPQVFYYSTSENGEKAANCLQDALNTELEITRPRVVKANDTYYLLKKTQATLVIAECGFLSNPKDEALLSDSAYQERVARALQNGIYEYLRLMKEQN